MSEADYSQIKLRPSSASIWTKCRAQPGYLLEVADLLPEEVEQDYTAEGREAHERAAEILNGLIDIEDVEDIEMAQAIRVYTEAVTETLAALGQKATASIECEFPCFYKADQRSFVDALLIAPGIWEVWDYKHGAGVRVEARNNPQLAIYAYNVLAENVGQFQTTDLVRMRIVQPRDRSMDQGESPVRQWNLTVEELEEWLANNVSCHAEAILNAPASENHRFAPSEATCRFCPAKAVCSARAGSLLNGTTLKPLNEQPEQAELAIPGHLSPEQIARVVQKGKEIKKWIDEVYDYATGEMEHGRLTIPGYKVVQSIGNRTWTDEDKALDLLRRLRFKKPQYVKEKPISPTQAERLMKESGGKFRTKTIKEFHSLIHRPTRGVTIVPEKDKRPSVAIESSSEFDNEENNQYDLL